MNNTTTFLEQIVDAVNNLKTTTTKEIIIVLPNKRAKTFLLNYFKKTYLNFQFPPTILNVEELIETISDLKQIDSLELLLQFYAVYVNNTPANKIEPFDTFSNWATILLQDFIEIDRYLIEPNKLFENLKEIEVLKRWNLQPHDKTELISNYLYFWEQLPMYYSQLNTTLLKNKIGHSGLLYRKAQLNLENYLNKNLEKYFFIAGFNALNAAEEIIFKTIISHKHGTLLWDANETLLNNEMHGAGYFLRKYKNNWSYYKSNPFSKIDNSYSEEKNIQIISTSKNIGQAKIVSSILSEIPENELEKTGVILGNENILLPILHQLPKTINSLNITMGFSAINNPAQQLIAQIFTLHTLSETKKTNSYYYKNVLKILENPLISKLINSTTLISTINKNNITYISNAKIIANTSQTNFTVVSLIFANYTNQPLLFLNSILELLLLIKNKLSNNANEIIVKNFVFTIYNTCIKIKNYCLTNSFINSIQIVDKMYKELIKLAEVSFEGEPLSGLQIMGVLESRLLDFETVIITSVNEGVMPKANKTNSFIPYDIKLGLGLPTFKEKDDIFTYHFYHILQRAKNVYLIYNSDENGNNSSEKSRYITQLEIEKAEKHTITYKNIVPKVPTVAGKGIEINKNSILLQKRLKEIATIKGFSPTALTNYLRNPIQFYFQRVLSINEEEEVEENIALNTIGTIIHKTLEELYKPLLNIPLNTQHIENLLMLFIDELNTQFKNIFKEGEITKGKNLLAFEMAKNNLQFFLNQELQAIKNGDQVIILAVEKNLSTVINHKKLPFEIKLSGNVDRIEIRNGIHRITDYKTGKVDAKNLKLNTFDAFLELKNEKIIQLLAYALMYQTEKPISLECGIYSFKNKKEGFIPFTYNKNNTQINSEILDQFTEQIVNLVTQIFDQNIPFKDTNND